MSGRPNQKIIGAILIGVALVAGAYTVTNFGKSDPSQSAALATSVPAPARTAITVSDKDSNGVEDWRDDFAIAEPVILTDVASSTYILPTTLTGQLGISLLQNVVNSRNSGPFGQTQDEVIGNTVEDLAQETIDTLYDTPDIQIIENWNETDVKNYANTMGGILLNAKSGAHENEIYILNDIVTRGKKERMSELVAISDDYSMFRDESLKVPVPAVFVKQHLDLLNAYNALRSDVSAMTQSFDDPVVTLIRLKRYQDDALGLSLSLQNMYVALTPYATLFTANDAAVFFSNFDPNSQSQ